MLVPDVDTYVEVVEADAYFDSLYGYDEWATLDEPTKEKLLRSAVQKLDLLCTWFGEKCDADQPLAFPRDTSDTCETPEGVKKAQCEIAYLFFSSGSAQIAEENPMKRMKAGGVEMEWFDRLPASDAIESGLAMDLLKQYGLCGGGSSTSIVSMELA